MTRYNLIHLVSNEAAVSQSLLGFISWVGSEVVQPGRAWWSQLGDARACNMFPRQSFVHIGSAYRANTVLIPRIPSDTPSDPSGTSSPWPDLIWQAPEGLPLGPFTAGCTSLWSLRGFVVDPCTAAWHDTPISNHGTKHTSCLHESVATGWHHSDCCDLWNIL